MKTNLDKWNYWNELIVTQTKLFIESQCETMPTKIYRIYPSGKIGIGEVTEVNYAYHINGSYFHLQFFTKKPTKDDVLKLKNYYELSIPMVKERIMFKYSEPFGTGTSRASSVHFLFDNSKNKNLTTCENQAKEISLIFTSKTEEWNRFLNEHKKDKDYKYIENGYKFLGWQNGWKSVYFDAEGNATEDATKRNSFGYSSADHPEYGTCKNANHNNIEVSHNQRGSENTVSCPTCKIYWKYDCSD